MRAAGRAAQYNTVQHTACPFSADPSLSTSSLSTPTADAEEREKLERQFGLERARASERIMRITEEHEMALATRMAQLGVLRD